MHKMVVNSREITTNYGEESMYAMHSGNPGKTQRLFIKRNDETTEQFLERLANSGYKKIRFARVSTNVIGWHHEIALCRR